MRPKIVIAILLPVALLSGAIFLFKLHSTAPAPAPVVTAAPAPAPVVTAAPAPVPAPAPVVKKTLTPEERQAAIDAETDRLSALAMNDDPQSLSNILADLTSPEKEIRVAAIEAAKQFESTNAIPVLKAAAANAEDNQEAIAMLEAADWLALPSVDFANNPGGAQSQLTPEQLQARKEAQAKAKARRQDYLQKRAGNQNSQSTSGPNSPGGAQN
jgi:CheY-like chemotaxis protein